MEVNGQTQLIMQELRAQKDWKFQCINAKLILKNGQIGLNWTLLNIVDIIHTIRKVQFLSKNSILTKPQHFHEFFTQKINNILEKSKLNFWTKNEDFEQCVRYSQKIVTPLHNLWDTFCSLP